MRRDVAPTGPCARTYGRNLRSSIKRLLVKADYPPDKQPGTIKLVMEEMEQLAPRYVEERQPTSAKNDLGELNPLCPVHSHHLDAVGRCGRAIDRAGRMPSSVRRLTTRSGL